jgi:hypothetical protein
VLQFLAAGRGLSFLQNVQTVFGPTQCPVDPGVKQPGPERDSSPPSTYEIKNAWNYTSTLPYAFVVYMGTALLNLMNSSYATHEFAHVCLGVGLFTRLAGPMMSKTRQVLLYYSVPALVRFFSLCFSIRILQAMGK